MLPELQEALAVLGETQPRLAESSQLYDSLLSGERPTRIPIAPGTTWYGFYRARLGVSLDEYLSDPETALKTELNTLSCALREFPEEDVNPSSIAVRINREQNSSVASAYCEVRHLGDEVGGYMAVPALQSIEDVGKLKVPHPAEIPAVQRVVEFGDYFLRQLDGQIPVSVPVPIMPFTDAAMIRGDTGFIYDLVDNPQEAKHLLEIAVETEIRVVKYVRERLGLCEPDTIGMADDATCYLSPQLYEEFAAPYERMAIDALSKSGKTSSVHLCGPSMHLLEIIKREFDPQTMLISYFGNVAQASGMMGRTALRGNADPRVLKQGTRSQIREHVLECLAQGSQHGPYYFASGTEGWLVGTPTESIHYAYSLIKDYKCQNEGGGNESQPNGAEGV